MCPVRFIFRHVGNFTRELHTFTHANRRARRGNLFFFDGHRSAIYRLSNRGIAHRITTRGVRNTHTHTHTLSLSAKAGAEEYNTQRRQWMVSHHLNRQGGRQDGCANLQAYQGVQRIADPLTAIGNGWLVAIGQFKLLVTNGLRLVGEPSTMFKGKFMTCPRHR